MYKLLGNSKNVMNITKAIKLREKKSMYRYLIGKFISVGKMTLYGICEACLKP